MEEDGEESSPVSSSEKEEFSDVRRELQESNSRNQSTNGRGHEVCDGGEKPAGRRRSSTESDTKTMSNSEPLSKAETETASNPLIVVPRRYCERRAIAYSKGVPEAEMSLMKIAKELLSCVKFGTDVTNIPLPASVLDPVSSLEKGLRSMQRGELLQDVAHARDPMERMWQIFRFYLSGLPKEPFGRKPYNPILGEVFRSCFKHRAPGGYTVLVAEQVSHHPPITALHLNNPTLGFMMNSFNAPEPKFWGNSLEIKLNGMIQINLTKVDEEYMLSRPTICMSGFVAGKQKLDFVGPISIECKESDLAIELEFKSTGLLGMRGTLHAVQGKLIRRSSRGTLYKISGFWDKKVIIVDVRTGKKRVIYDYDAIKKTHAMDAILPPAEELEDTNSLIVWEKCSRAIWAGDTYAANNEKRKVEEKQRKSRRELEAQGKAHGARYFERCKEGQGYVLKEEVYRQLHPPLEEVTDNDSNSLNGHLNGVGNRLAGNCHEKGSRHSSFGTENDIANGMSDDIIENGVANMNIPGKEKWPKKRRHGPRIRRGFSNLGLTGKKREVF